MAKKTKKIDERLTSSYDFGTWKTIGRTPRSGGARDLYKVNAMTATKVIGDVIFPYLADHPDVTYDQIVKLCHDSFEAAGIDTDWTRWFFATLAKSNNRNIAMIFLKNCYLSGRGMPSTPRNRHF